MNVRAIAAIYQFEMARTFRTLAQSIAAPVISSALYFIVFGSAIGNRMMDIEGEEDESENEPEKHSKKSKKMQKKDKVSKKKLKQENFL